MPQVDTVTIGGSVEFGDTYSVTVNGTTVSHTTAGDEITLAAVRDALVTALGADAGINTVVDVAAGAADGEIVLTAFSPGASFTASVSASDVGGFLFQSTSSGDLQILDPSTAGVVMSTTLVNGKHFTGLGFGPDGVLYVFIV